MFTWVLLDGFLKGFSKFGFFIVEICILIRDFWVIFENYSMRTLSIRGNDFIAHWASEEWFHRTLSIRRTNFSVCSASGKMLTVFTCTIYAEHSGKWYYHTLSIRGNDLNAGWAYEEMISSLTEHTRKCLNVEYLGRIKYDFQKLELQALGTIRIRFLQKKFLQNGMLVYLYYGRKVPLFRRPECKLFCIPECTV